MSKTTHIYRTTKRHIAYKCACYSLSNCYTSSIKNCVGKYIV